MIINRKDLLIRDPYILLEGDTYYMYGTCNHLNPDSHGFDAYKSKDLEVFEGPYNVFLKNDDFWGEKQFWAPEVYKINNKYYMIATFKGEKLCRGCHILVSDNPLGPFVPYDKKRITPNDWECLDATLFQFKNENYIIFCHEWLQVHDGEICIEKISSDLKKVLTKPTILFKGSNAKWTKRGENYITDGPFLLELANGKVLMIWSSGGYNGYTTGYAINEGIDLTKNWIQIDEPIFENGGHGMIFVDKDRNLRLALHTPNKGDCRAVFLYANIDGDKISLSNWRK